MTHIIIRREIGVITLLQRKILQIVSTIECLKDINQ